MTGSLADKSKPLEAFKFPWPFPKTQSLLYKWKSLATMGFVSAVSRILFIGGANKIIVHNKERFIKLWEDKSRPLITIANHRSNIDDPLIWAMTTWGEFLRNVNRHRYTLAAHNICFSKQWHTTMFSLGRCVPCVRGTGVYQQGMDFSVDQLNKNGWVHIFPEGKVTPHPIRFKWGVGRLIMDAERPPIVLPIWCQNMEQVWPVQPPYYPKFGQTVHIHIGEPVDTSKILDEARQKFHEVADQRKAITDSLQDSLFTLGEKTGYLAEGSARKVRDESSVITKL